MTIELNQLRAKALGWLGRQEYYQRKLRQKLQQHQASDEQIESIIAEFTSHNWLNEQRYCDGFVRSRLAKGQGIMRITADGRQKGLARDCLEQALDVAAVDWFELAKITYNKRFAAKGLNIDGSGDKEKAKRMRFMQYRGFDMEQIRYAMTQNDEDQL